MTPAVAPPLSPPSSHQPRAVPLIILGTDALLAAAPATPVQLAHACLRAGFANVLPASWGDELIATATLRRLPEFAGSPVIQCSCPIVAHRLLNVGGDLRPAMLGFVAPPVAVARYVRRLAGSTPTRITYVGGCPGANDPSIDIRMSPEALLALLADREITLDDQPRVFESVLPPDRRRFRSQPGGVPAVEALWSEAGSRTFVEVGAEDLVTELAQQLLTGRNVLIDAAPSLGCVCCGAVQDVAARDARSAVTALEPPRASMAVIDETVGVDLELPVPASPRTPIDVGAVASHGLAGKPTPPAAASLAAHHRHSPARPIAAISDSKAAGRPSGPIALRAVLGAAPVTRDVEGKSLPRAYVARRRQSPRHLPVVLPVEAPRPDQSPIAPGRKAVAIAQVAVEVVDSPAPPEPTTAPPMIDPDASPASILPVDHASTTMRPTPPVTSTYAMPAASSIQSAPPIREQPAPVSTRPADESSVASASRRATSSRPRVSSNAPEPRASAPDSSARKVAIIVGAIVLWAALSVGTGVVVARFLRPSFSSNTTGVGR